MLTRLRAVANACGANSCVLCGLHCVADEGLCDACHHCLPRWYPRCCQHLSAARAEGRSLHCDYWFAALRWQPITRQLIYRYKTGGETDLLIPFAHWLAAHLIVAYRTQSWPDRIVAMPTTRQRWCQRGFHHTALLAERVAELVGIPYQPSVLRVVKVTEQQKQQHQWQRWQAAAGSQYATTSVEGQSIAVIDDIISTGATLSAAASALRKRGAKQVHGWALIYNQGG